jgi:uncharacterized protein YndB with AHSA1/START domain
MEINNQQKVEASKQFSVPVEKLYEAWNNPDQLKQWWKPLGNALREVTNDLKPGGTVRYVFDDNTLVISGTYEEVEKNQKLVYSWNWQFPDNAIKNASYKLTVQFSSTDSGSKINVVQETIKSEEIVHPNEDGWNKGLSDLESFLTGKDSSEDSANEGQSGTGQEEPGYRERPEQQKVGGG